jgi:hypothetical protein
VYLGFDWDLIGHHCVRWVRRPISVGMSTGGFEPRTILKKTGERKSHDVNKSINKIVNQGRKQKVWGMLKKSGRVGVLGDGWESHSHACDCVRIKCGVRNCDVDSVRDVDNTYH